MERRPEWHMRPGFLVALVVIIVGGTLLDWRIGVILLIWLVSGYAWHRINARVVQAFRRRR